jgi:hypothetical protein
MAWPENVKAIFSGGIPLSKIGVNNWALTKNQSIQALNEFEILKIPILGGDVYEIHDDEPESNYDNWYCNQNDNEELDEFVARSVSYAREYIRNYSNASGRESYFVFVV